MPLVRRTRATLRSAEFGFFGVWVKTRTQTPRFCGLTCNAGLFVLVTIFLRPWRTSWLIVGISAYRRKLAPAAPKSKRERGCERHSRGVVSGLKSGAAYVADVPRLAPETE